LRKACELKETVFAYHHLALTLKKKIERNIYSDPVREQAAEHQVGNEMSWHQQRHERNKRQNKGTGRTSNSSLLRSHKTIREHAFKNAIKSPRTVEIYRGNLILLEAIECLQKAIDISPGEPMLYDKALVYRMLDLPEKALETLNLITAKKTITISDIFLVSVYNQKAMCLRDLQTKSDGIDEKERIFENEKAMLYKAIELQGKLIKDEQIPESVWNAYSTLKDYLDTDHDPQAKSKLAKIHKLMNDPRQAIRLLKELRENNGGDLSTNDYKLLVDSFVENRQFSEAIIFLQILEDSEEDYVKNEETWVVGTYIEVAVQAMREDDLNMVRSRFRHAYDKRKGSEHQILNDRDAVEIHIVHGCPHGDDCESPKNFYRLLEKYTDLKVTINTEDCVGKLKYSAMQSMMESSEHILILVQNKYDRLADYYFNQALNVSQARGNLLLAADENIHVPSILNANTIPKINLPANCFNCKLKEAETSVQLSMDIETEIIRRFFKSLCRTKK